MKRFWNLLTLASRPKPPVGSTPADVLWTENKWRLLHYRRATPARFATPVLLVPSLINRHYVLDLVPGKSFAEYLLAQGHDVFAIDWGAPTAEDRYVTFDDVCDTWLGRAIRKTAQAQGSGAGDAKVHLLGYCMGGTLCAIHAAAHPERVASVCALAAPVRFEDGGMLTTWTRSPAFATDKLVDALGIVPWPLLQASFQMLRPTLGLAKAVNLVDRAWNDRYLDSFLALETWANDNVSLPGEFFRRYINDLYRQDLLWHGRFSLGGRPARLQAIRCPTLTIAFTHDGISPLQSCKALHEAVGSDDKQLVELAGSHVGGVVSREASLGLWPLLSGWWAARDGVGGVVGGARAESRAAAQACATTEPAGNAEGAETAAPSAAAPAEAAPPNAAAPGAAAPSSAAAPPSAAVPPDVPPRPAPRTRARGRARA